MLIVGIGVHKIMARLLLTAGPVRLVGAVQCAGEMEGGRERGKSSPGGCCVRRWQETSSHVGVAAYPVRVNARQSQDVLPNVAPHDPFVRAPDARALQNDVPAGRDDVPRLVVDLAAQLVRPPPAVARDQLKLRRVRLPAVHQLRCVPHSAVEHTRCDLLRAGDPRYAVHHTQHAQLDRAAQVQRVATKGLEAAGLQPHIPHHQRGLAIQHQPVAPLRVFVVEQQDDGAVEEAHVRLPGHQETALLRLRDQMRPATGALRARAVGELNRVLCAGVSHKGGVLFGDQPRAEGPPVAANLWRVHLRLVAILSVSVLVVVTGGEDAPGVPAGVVVRKKAGRRRARRRFRTVGPRACGGSSRAVHRLQDSCHHSRSHYIPASDKASLTACA
mmetsp:Transcript_15401/g.27258  ORF Transcript_15401/g.27258 Transcript_15401/m.27258 type:complete len:387 (-) Transcript_15401:104-1264(-)